MSKKAQAKKAAVTVTIPANIIRNTVKAINEAASANDTAVAALAKLDNDYHALAAKSVAEALVTGGAKWSSNTIMQELGRIRRLKAAGKYEASMTSYQLREADKALPKTPRAPTAPKGDKAAPTAGTASTAPAPQVVSKISREAPDTIAKALIDAIMASGLEDAEQVLSEARRLIVAAVNAKKKTDK